MNEKKTTENMISFAHGSAKAFRKQESQAKIVILKSSHLKYLFGSLNIRNSKRSIKRKEE